MTDPTLDHALESLTQFAGAPDPKAWSLDGEPFDLGLAVSVVRDRVADLRDELKAAEASLDGARAAAKTMADVANGLDLDVKRWRDQCPVTDEHVKTADLTWGHVDAWVLAQPDGEDRAAADGRPMDSWRKKRDNPDGPTWQFGVGALLARGQGLEFAVTVAARVCGRPAHDILDEMAAIEVPT